jgi:hypothetical protein
LNLAWPYYQSFFNYFAESRNGEDGRWKNSH